jgi:hypothetical protein
MSLLISNFSGFLRGSGFKTFSGGHSLACFRMLRDCYICSHFMLGYMLLGLCHSLVDISALPLLCLPLSLPRLCPLPPPTDLLSLAIRDQAPAILFLLCQPVSMLFRFGSPLPSPGRDFARDHASICDKSPAPMSLLFACLFDSVRRDWTKQPVLICNMIPPPPP